MSSDIGLLGLGTMGRALALNIAEKGYGIAVFNRTREVTEHFAAEAGELAPRITPCETLEGFVAALARPRAIILMVPAGRPVDEMIAALRPLLAPEDLIIDAGNADFRETRRRSAEAAEKGELFLGMGVSGGEEGARHGPSIMGGGPREAWDRVAPILEAIAAKHEGEPCATWMGEDGAGHFVKTVHNGIEYADMQMIAEVYGVLRDGMGMEATEIADVFDRWNEGPLRSYLIEISGIVARTIDPETHQPLLDVILDTAGQKGTGRWTAIEALMLGAPASAIEAAVGARNLSARLDERKSGEAIFGPAPRGIAETGGLIDELGQALLAGKIACYAQGFGLLADASREFGWNLPLDAIAKVWREGCIIRSAMLDDMAQALAVSGLTNLMFAPSFASRMAENHGGLRAVVARAALSGIAAPALGAALAYFDTMRTARGTANLLQGQRDFFGLHGFARLDRAGTHHGPWADSFQL
ncbi:NADP-dependent phosphogluconate dehydrogenase [Amaricoccus solimangrovi]|uniref:6-phosphogluconate dehydrogenase, decarboxylating n=1 Tax=Amaricoccus solimangrovi TaxID=2589815 RepID=A0A501WR17_9RHOB|nr:NADP-dependent phosphogluconate dehydrogenase [Amaricoccus solimangrovi]TPE50785.1 NADP-dependent phosphogluconate dehydrogenase [Amaricoccus solimangrovi]